MTHRLLLLTLALGGLIAATATLHAVPAIEIWQQQCALCHGMDGKGETPVGRQWEVRDFTDPNEVTDLTDARIVEVVTEGIKDEKGRVKMIPFGQLLTEKEIQSMVAYVRALRAEGEAAHEAASDANETPTAESDESGS